MDANPWGLEPLLHIGELADYLGVPVSTVYDWRRRGLGPRAYRFGKHLKFALSDVRTWVEVQREPDKVGIVGFGGLGTSATKIAHLAGAEVHVAEPRQESWVAAKEMGATDVVADSYQWFGRGFDVVIDFAGFGTTTAAALRAVRRGDRVVQVGMGQLEAPITTGLLCSNRVNLGGDLEEVRAVMELLGDGELEMLVVETTIDGIPAALDRLRSGEIAGRAVAVMDD